MTVRPRRTLRYVAAVGAALAIGVVVLGYAVLVAMGPTRTAFASPSGRWVFAVEEACLGHACSHDAYIESSSFFSSDRRRCAFPVHGDSIAFTDGSVTWLPDESGVEWFIPMYNQAGAITFDRDCER